MSISKQGGKSMEQTKSGNQKSEKVCVTIKSDLYEIGKTKAEKLGISFSAYVSLLIAKDNYFKKKEN